MPLRHLRRSPLYSTTVLTLLGLGIGASTVLFTALDAFLLRPLPVVRPERLARLGVEASPTHVTFDHSTVYARVLAERGRSFDAVFTFFPLDAAFIAGRHVETLTCQVVSDNYFAALGLHAETGAFFGRNTQGSLPAVISHNLWRRVFAGSESVIGSGIRLRGAAFTVAGVMPPNFGGLDLERRSDVWVPDSAWMAWTGNDDIQRAPAQIFVRLREGVSLAQAEAEVRVLYPAMVDADLAGQKLVTASDVAHHKQRRVLLASAGQGVSAMRRQFSAAAPLLLGAIGALLLLIAANVSGLMLARTGARRAEFTVRRGLGATGWDILRAMLTESVILAAGGALLGWLIAQYCGPLLITFLPSRRPLNIALQPDMRVFAFTTAITAGVALLVSIAPAISALRTNLTEVLGRSGARVTSPALGRAIVAVQVAVAMIVLAVSISLVRSLDGLRNADPGFNRDRLVVAVLDARMAGVKSPQLPTVYEEILRRAREIPGAADASMAGAPLMRGVGFKNTMGPTGARLTAADRLNISLNYATETHFDNLGMKFLAGRGIGPADVNVRPTAVVVTESLARQFFPGADPLGREFGPAGPDGLARPNYRIVGVVRDVKYRGMREVAPPTFFAPFSGDEEFVTLHVRTRLHEAVMMRQIRAMLATVGPGLSPVSLATMEQEIETSLWQERMLSLLAEVFAVLATAIAGFGLFGLVAFTLARRTREVGIRVAVGATPRRIVGLFARHTGAAVVPGMLLGAGAFVLARRFLEPLLFGPGVDVVTPVFASAFILIIVVVASVAAPISRATRIEATAALRQE